MHDATKTIENGVFVLFFFNTNLFLLKKNKTNRFLENKRLGFKENCFFSIILIFQSFFVIFPLSHDLKQVMLLSV